MPPKNSLTLNAENRKKAGQIEARREANRIAQQIRRQNLLIRMREQNRDTTARRITRQDLQVRAAEQQQDTAARRVTRQNLQVRAAEQQQNTAARRATRQEPTEWERAVAEYEQQIQDGPMHRCYSCDRLWFKKQLHKRTRAQLKTSKCTDEYINVLVLEELHKNLEYWFCNTCIVSVRKKSFPRLNIQNSGIKFPDVPDVVKNLTSLAERCVALRIPFMKIITLGCDRQYGIKSGVVNVPIDVRKTIQAIPAHPNASGVIEVTWMRSMRFKNYYMKARVNRASIWNAAVALCQKTLYKAEGVVLDNNFNANNPEEIEIDSAEGQEEQMDVDEANVPQIDEKDTELLEIRAQNENYIPEETMLDSAEGIQFAPGEDQTPLPILMDKYCEEMAFPTIWGGEPRRCNENVKLSFEDHVSSEIRRFDRRAVKPEHLLFLYKKAMIKQLLSKVNIVFRKAAVYMNVTAQQAINRDFINDAVAKDNVYRFMNSITGSPAYWEQQKKNVLGMVRQFGIFSLFITLTAAETHWKELLKILKIVVDKQEPSDEELNDMAFEEKSRLISSDPVTCALYFDHRVKSLMATWKARDGPFGIYKIAHYYYRVEFQHRGSPHIHMVVWLKDAPRYNPYEEGNTSMIIEFIDQLMTTEDNEEMADLVKYQMHKCSFTCKRMVNGQQICRFGSPFPPMDQTVILEPLPKNHFRNMTNVQKDKIFGINTKLQNLLTTSARTNGSFEDLLTKLECTRDEYITAIRSTINRTKFFLKRLPKDCLVTGYNKKILSLMRSNMDIQFVTEAYACVGYIVDYINKSSRGLSRLLRQCVEDYNRGNHSLREKLNKLANIMYNSSEICAQEAVWARLRLPMSYGTSTVEFINTSPIENRQHMLKSKAELERIYAENPNSTDILTKGQVERYTERPNQLNDLCLADFVANWTIKGKGAVDPLQDEEEADAVEQENVDRRRTTKLKLLDGTEISERRESKVIRYRRYNKENDPDNYFREMILLFLPFRDEKAEVEDVNKEEVFLANREVIERNYKKYNESDLDFNEICNELEKERRVQNNEQEEGEQNEQADEEGRPDEEIEEFVNVFDYDDTVIQPNIVFEFGEQEWTAEQVRKYVVPDQMLTDEFLTLCDRCNEKQRDYQMEIRHHFLNKDLPFYHFVSGKAGVGKSHLIKTIYQDVLRILRKDAGNAEGVEVLLVAYTGKAAHNIGGMTAHGAFALNAGAGQSRVTELSADNLNTLAAQLYKLKLIIIDEISMLSSNLFDQIHRTLTKVFRTHNTDKIFGGVSVIVVGDFNQLAPIGSYVFEARSDPIARIVGNQIWPRFKYFELDEVMRQKDDKLFAEVLNRLAVGQMTEEDKQMFRDRQFSEDPIEVERSNGAIKLLPPEGKQAIRLFPYNAEVDAFNEERIRRHKATNPDVLAIKFTAMDTLIGRVTPRQSNQALHSLENKKTNDTAGLPKSLELVVGIRYMVSTNIDVSDGLFNGASGILRMAEVFQRKVNSVYIEFDDLKIGLKARAARKAFMDAHNISQNWTPIARTKKVFNVLQSGSVQVCREQYPLVVAEGITCHKSQGQSMERVAVHLGARSLQRKLVYVACSRATSLNGLYLIGELRDPKPPTRKDFQVDTEIQRLKTSCLLTPRFKMLRDQSADIQLVSFNVQSLHKHAISIRADQVYTVSNVLCFQEIWMNNTDDAEIPNMVEVVRNPSTIRKAEGTIIYTNINSGLMTSQQKSIKQESGQHQHIEATSCMVDDIVVINIYKNPATNNRFFKDFINENFAAQLNQPNVIICGDFNQDLSGPGAEIENFFETNFNIQLLSTRLATTIYQTTMDGVFGRLECFIYESYFSDHKPLVVRLKRK